MLVAACYLHLVELGYQRIGIDGAQEFVEPETFFVFESDGLPDNELIQMVSQRRREESAGLRRANTYKFFGAKQGKRLCFMVVDDEGIFHRWRYCGKCLTRERMLGKQLAKRRPACVAAGDACVQKAVFLVAKLDAQQWLYTFSFAGAHKFKAGRCVVDIGQNQGFYPKRGGGLHHLCR